MGRRILMIECSNVMWVDILKKINEQDSWQPVYWTTGSRYLSFDKILSVFPRTIVQENYDAVRGISAKTFKDDDFQPVDSCLVKELAFHETVVLKMMDRMDPIGQFTYSDRVRLYHFYLKYWSHVLEKLQPDILLISEAPHLCYDYVLYQLCKKKGIEIIVTTTTTLPFTFYLSRYFEEIPQLLADKYDHLLKNKEQPVLTRASKEYIEKLSGNYDTAIPSYMVEQYAADRKASRQSSFLSKGYLKAKSVASFIKNELFTSWHSEQLNAYYKSKYSNIEEGTLTQLESKRYAAEMTRRTALLKRNYNALQTEPDLNMPYVFVALMYQPERTSCPDGDIFMHQYLMVEWLSACVPENWMIYVKEHPSQFLFYVDQTRNKNMYGDMLKLKNVRLIPTKTNTFQLIDSCQAVATLSGTVGFESIVRGVPVLCFGYAWYRGCDGVLIIDQIKKLKAAIQLISGGYRPEMRKVLKFAQAIEEIGVKGYLDVHSAKDFDYQTNIDNIHQALLNFKSSAIVN